MRRLLTVPKLHVRGVIPTGVGWDTGAYPVVPDIRHTASGWVGDAGVTPEALFDAASTARSAPTATYYVAGAGADTNAGTIGAPFRTLRKAIQTVNGLGAGQTAKIVMVCTSNTDPSWSYEYGFETDTFTLPQRDIALVASGGRPKLGPWMPMLTPTINTGATNQATDPNAAGTGAFTAGNANGVVTTVASFAGATSATAARFTVTSSAVATRISAGMTLGLGFPNAGQLVRIKFKAKFSNAAMSFSVNFRPQASLTTNQIVLRAVGVIGDTLAHTFEYDFYVPNGATLTASAGIWLTPVTATVVAGNTVDITDISLKAIWTTSDPVAAPGLDPVYTNCYAMPYSDNARPPMRVVDTLNVDAYGVATELALAANAAACNSTAGTWFFVAGTSDAPRGTLLMHRTDAVPVTDANTLVGVRKLGFLSQNNVNLWFEGLDFISGRGGAMVAVGPSTVSATPLVSLFKDCTFSYGGGWTAGNLDNNAVSIVGMQGIAAFFSCVAKGLMADAYNCHTQATQTVANFLTVNCTALVLGTNGTSRNGWTIHEAVKGIDINGNYKRTHGGTIHNIGTSKTYMLGTVSADDLGDVVFGGSIPPTQYRVSDTAEMWLDHCYATGSPGGVAYDAHNVGSAIHIRRAQNTTLTTVAVGTVNSY